MVCEGCKHAKRAKSGNQWVYLCRREQKDRIIATVPAKNKRPFVPVPAWCRSRENAR